ncbi:MAG TPA: polysaccharide deacetylase family protein [Candidatus Saccharimonadales bacterium]|nr:polysaccharide deacetylase family protein [Candidatus Saccharimonadales bacterium]
MLNPTPVKLSSKLSSVATAPPKLAADGNLLKALPDCSKVACLALTFDDGPNPNTTPEILNILEEHSVAATFFVVGIRIPGHEDLLQRMQAGGQEIGNHSWSHPNFTKLTPEQIKQQINQTQAAVVTAGVPAPTLFRPPYGAINQTVIDNVPLTFMFWNEDPKDWAANTPEEVVKAVEASAKPGGVIELHDIYHVTTNALPKILDDLTAQGFHFVTVSQLLNLTPETRGQFYGRHQPVL